MKNLCQIGGVPADILTWRLPNKRRTVTAGTNVLDTTNCADFVLYSMS
jgi:hypothetical protein